LRPTILPGGGFFISMPRLIIFANGLVPDLESTRKIIQPGDTLFAADGGTQHALALGLMPSMIFGDMDSLSPEDRRLLSQDVEIQLYPRDKNETDLELALLYAIGTGYRNILIVGALGGRLDQTLGNLSLLTDPRLSSFDIRLDDGVEEAFFTRTRSGLLGNPGDIVSLIPWGGEVTGVSTQGLRWPLHEETLLPDKTRGISNEMLNEQAAFEIASGLLLCVHRRKNVFGNQTAEG
jgi:thiamine pyrophosphokinase